MNHKGKWNEILERSCLYQSLASNLISSPHIKQPLLIQCVPFLRVFLGLGVINEPPTHDLLNFWEDATCIRNLCCHLCLTSSRCLVFHCHLPNSPCGSLTTLNSPEQQFHLLNKIINTTVAFMTSLGQHMSPHLGFDHSRSDHTRSLKCKC